MRNSKIKKIISIILSLITVFGICLTVSNAAGDYTTNSKFKKISSAEAQSKYSNGDKFILYCYKTGEGASVCDEIGNKTISDWMNLYNYTVYGICLDSAGYVPSWIAGALGKTSEIYLPVVIFANNKSLNAYEYDPAKGAADMKAKIQAKFLSFTGLKEIVIHNDNLYSIDLKYYQADARTMLSELNSFRRSSPQCWNNTNTAKITYSGLGDLYYDYDLEKIAMQRAAEVAIHFDHNRPNGELYYTAYNTYTHCRENLAYGYSNAHDAQIALEEADEFYNSQGHRRNMVNNDCVAVAFACAELNGVKYWVQEFRSPISNTASTSAFNGTKAVTIDILPKYIESAEYSLSKSTYSMVEGASAELPEVSAKLKIGEAIESDYKVNAVPDLEWKSSNTAVADVESGYIIAKGKGNTTVTAKSGSKTLSITVNVASNTCEHNLIPHQRVEATCELPGNEAYYTCSKCDYTTFKAIPQKGHSFTNYVFDNNASEYSDGTETAKCDRCNATDTRTAEGTRYTKNEVTINCASDSVSYRQKVTFIARASNVPDGYKLAIFHKGSIMPVATGTQTTVEYNISEIKDSEDLTVAVVDGNSNILKKEDGTALTKAARISVNKGLFTRIIAFFKILFGLDYSVIIQP